MKLTKGYVRDRSAGSNVIELPKADRVRLEDAISAFDRGDQSAHLADEFRSLAAKGYREASYFSGCIYEDGSNGEERDLEAALREYQLSAQEFGYVEGYLAVARFKYYGKGSEVDYSEAFRLYRHVAELRGHPVACFMLGRMYRRGQGVAMDLSAARMWAAKAASLGSIYGMLELALLEQEVGHHLRHLYLRFAAGIRAFLIARRNPRDIRLRPG